MNKLNRSKRKDYKSAKKLNNGHNNHTAGFSLVELVIVLVIVALICSIQVFPGKLTKNRIAELLFWRNFRQNWTSLVVETKLRRDAGVVLFFSDTLYFCAGSNSAEKKALEVPSSLHLRGGKKDENLYQNGGTQPQSITFHSDLDQKDYTIVFQLGYGGQYHVEETQK